RVTSGQVGQRRTPPRPSSAGQQRNETIRICQGVSVPDGYVIIAYTTSSACPHGAYLLKKQASYDSSFGVARTNEPAAQPATSNASANASKTRRNGKSAPSAQKSPASETVSAGLGSPPSTGSSSRPAATENNKTSAASSATRPRRVTSETDTQEQPARQVTLEEQAANQEQTAAPPSLIGGEIA